MEDRSVLEQLSHFPPVPWTPRDVFWGLGTSLLLVFTLILVGGLLKRLGVSVDTSLVIIFGTGLLLLPIWYFTIFKYNSSWAELGLRSFEPKAVSLGCGLMLLSMFFNFIYGLILGIYGYQIQPDIGPLFSETRFPLLLLFGGAIVAPIIEELFFRGFVFAGLRNRWDWKKAALLSAVLFALAHMVPTSILPIFILGMIFAFLYQVSGSIWPAILMHMLTNAIALSAAYAISQGWISTP
jgi:membrane protease YdiL (CAAX protease family)